VKNKNRQKKKTYNTTSDDDDDDDNDESTGLRTGTDATPIDANHGQIHPKNLLPC
jgi:hypothetical protein